MHTAIAGTAFVLGSVLVTLLCMVLVRRLISHQTLSRHHDVAGFIYATMGVTYAVILAFVVIAVWEKYDNAESVATGEANSLGALYRLAGDFPTTESQASRAAVLAYAEAVVSEEWPAMTHEAAPSPLTSAQIENLFYVYGQPAFVADVNQAQYAESLRLVDDVSVARRARILQSEAGLPGLIWAALIGGGVVVIGFAFLFGVENSWYQAAMLTALAATISLLLFVVYALDHPYRGVLAQRPEGLELMLRQFVYDRQSDAGGH